MSSIMTLDRFGRHILQHACNIESVPQIPSTEVYYIPLNLLGKFTLYRKILLFRNQLDYFSPPIDCIIKEFVIEPSSYSLVSKLNGIETNLIGQKVNKTDKITIEDPFYIPLVGNIIKETILVRIVLKCSIVNE